MTGPRIKRIDGIEEADFLADLQKAILTEDYLYDTAKGVWWVAWDGDVAAGFAGIVPSTITGWGYLARAGVAKPYRGMGLQKRFIRIRVAYARKQGWSKVVTDTSYDNHASSNSLMSCGFRLHEPGVRWGFRHGLYWQLNLDTAP